MKTTVLIADDHPLLLKGNMQYLQSKGYNIVASASDGNDAYHQILKLEPQIAILDEKMPKLSGIEVAKAAKKSNVETKIIILTSFKEAAIAKEVGQSIEGYILKESALEEIDTCIHEVLKGNTYTSVLLNEQIYFDASNNQSIDFTPSELKILKYIARNLTSNQIADELFISKRTVEKHRSNIIKKIGLSGKPNALILWLQKHPALLEE